MPSLPRNIVVALCCAVILSSCLARYRRHEPLPEITRPLLFVQSVMRTELLLTDITAIVRISISSPRGSAASKNVLLMKPPAYIRLETLGFMGHPALISMTDGVTIQVYLLQDNTFFSGPAVPDNLSKIFGTPVSVSDIAGILRGIPCGEVTAAQCFAERTCYRCNLETGNGPCTVWIDPRLRVITRFQGMLASEQRRDITFDDFKAVNGMLMPFSISVVSRDESISMSLRYASVDTGRIGIEAFSQPPPKSADVLPFDDFPPMWY